MPPNSARLTPVLLLGLGLPGCFLGRDVAFLEHEDVAISGLRETSARAATEYGDVYATSLQTAHEVNGWLGAALDGAATVLEALERLPPSSRADGWNTYGPYDDREDRAWLVRLSGDPEHGEFEVWVGPRGASDTTQLERLLWGEVTVDGDRREGSCSLDFDVIEHWNIKSGPDVDRHYTGRARASFARDRATEEKHVAIAYDDFEVVQDLPLPDYLSVGSYAFDRDADGAGTFHLDLVATFQTMIWSGPERESMMLDLVWDAAGAGRGRGAVTGFAGEGDLSHGDLIVEECFGPGGALVWRDISPGYDAAFPEYDLGSPAACGVDGPAAPPRGP